MPNHWHTTTGKFHYDYGVYFNNKFVMNGTCSWYFNEDADYYATIREIDNETIEVLSYVEKTLQVD